jgi:hypothetical protein
MNAFGEKMLRVAPHHPISIVTTGAPGSVAFEFKKAGSR